VPTYSAARTLLASRKDVWAFLAEPHHLTDWWPGVAGVQPDRRGLAPGARWQVQRGERPTLLRRSHSDGMLLVSHVDPLERIAFHLTRERLDADLRLRALDADRTEVTLSVTAPWLVGLGRRFPDRALDRLHALVRTAEEP
jgi:uncharacterized protein YndB with AHSA1/START domain